MAKKKEKPQSSQKIFEILEEKPESMSRAFILNDVMEDKYLLLGPPRLIGRNGIRSVANVVKIHKDELVVLTEVIIRDKHKISPMIHQSYLNAIDNVYYASIRRIKSAKDVNDLGVKIERAKKTLKNIIAYGLRKDTEEAQEIL